MVNPIPDGFHSVTPHLLLNGCADAIEFYKQAFGAEEVMRMPGPGGMLMHAEIRIGDSIIMLGDEMPGPDGCAKSPTSIGGTAVVLSLYVEDVDASFQRAVAAGAEVAMPPTDMFWGDRYSSVKDKWGHQWSIATHTKDMTPEEIGAAAQEFMQQMSGDG